MSDPTGPTGRPRLLVLMGSGETSPTMVRVHRDLLARLGPAPVPAVLLDTPFGFQSNADDIVRRAVAYFRHSVGATIDVAGFRRAGSDDALARETMLARLREAAYVFSGPGSPTYALRQWGSSHVPDILRAKLRTGGCIAFASAAALTVGVATVPVYEIYKAGADPCWLPGLDLLVEAGLSAAVIPHYDNAEGGTHDTRFCYLGEVRLAAMERELPPGAFVLGVDEHTACVLDLDAGTASVHGLGGVTVRAAGRSSRFESGSTVAVTDLREAAARLRSGGTPSAGGEPRRVAGAGSSPRRSEDLAGAPAGTGDHLSPLLAGVARRQAELTTAVDAGKVADAVSVVLALEEELDAWSADTLESDELDRGRAALRSMIAGVADAAARAADAGARDATAPLVDALVELRDAARALRRWDEADAIRRRLESMGIEVRDGPSGSGWSRRQ